MYNLSFSNQFKKDLKSYQHNKKYIQLLEKVLVELEQNGYVNKEYKPHILKHNYKEFWECHILEDFLLIWRVENKEILLVRIGSHSKLFK